MKNLNNKPYVVTGVCCLLCGEVIFPPQDNKKLIQRYSKVCRCGSVAINNIRLPRPKDEENYKNKGNWKPHSEVTYIYTNSPKEVEVIRGVVGVDGVLLNPKLLQISAGVGGVLGEKVPETLKEAFKDILHTDQPPDLQRKVVYGGRHQGKTIQRRHIQNLNKLKGA